MTGLEHYRIAEQLAASVTGERVPVMQMQAIAALAQVHALLALTEAVRHGNRS